jgi:hypothetical protein
MAKAKEVAVKVVADVTQSDELVKLKQLLARLTADNSIELKEGEANLLAVDWNKLVRKEGKIEISGNDYITLAELRRLARLRGYISSLPKVIQSPVYDNHRQATVEWEIVWKDGTIDGAAADASWRTCNPGFRNFTVAIASNRAEARCIRSALGIETCSYEEMGPEDEDLSGVSSDQQKAAIVFLMKRNNIGVKQLVDVFGPEIASRITDGEAINISTLTHQEAVKMMAALNKFKPAKGE